MIQIPTFQTTSADFNQEIELGGQLVQLRIVYNIRVGFFFLDFTDQNGNVLYQIKMVPTWPLLSQHRGFIDFDGDILILKTDAEAGDNVSYDNFGNGWDLFYLSPDELSDWRDENGL